MGKIKGEKRAKKGVPPYSAPKCPLSQLFHKTHKTHKTHPKTHNPHKKEIPRTSYTILIPVLALRSPHLSPSNIKIIPTPHSTNKRLKNGYTLP